MHRAIGNMLQRILVLKKVFKKSQGNLLPSEHSFRSRYSRMDQGKFVEDSP